MTITEDKVNECVIKYGILLVLAYAVAAFLYDPQYLSSLPDRFIDDMPLSSGRFLLFLFGSIIAHVILHALPVITYTGSIKAVKFGVRKFMPYTHYTVLLSRSLYSFAIALPVLILGFGLLVYALINDDYLLQFISLINIVFSIGDVLILSALIREEKGVLIQHSEMHVGYTLA